MGRVRGDPETVLNDEDDVVRESCIPALDAAEYWGYNVAILATEDEDGVDGSDCVG